MDTLRVLVIDPQPGSRLGTLEAPIVERGHELVRWRSDEAPPPPLDGVDAVIALGGSPHPDHDDRHPWLAGERAVLRQVLADDVPTVGICLGAQLLAQAAGGQAGRLPLPEIGWHDVELLPAAGRDPLLGGFPSRFAALQWHEYGFTPPPGAEPLARSARAPHQAARLADRAWALQFHIEVDGPTVEDWARRGAGELADAGLSAEELTSRSAREVPRWERLARELAGRFLDVAEGVRRAA